ncbi:MAG TPA: hypothetical protein VIW94_06045 [Acidimicrobiia bacterium]
MNSHPVTIMPAAKRTLLGEFEVVEVDEELDDVDDVDGDVVLVSGTRVVHGLVVDESYDVVPPQAPTRRAKAIPSNTLLNRSFTFLYLRSCPCHR